ncbi:MAG: 30S ribosomal protein S16 [Ignavibacteriaceae bacterium]|nr:30S ribosomal protein S16 [Ignavibacteriaceae bacterium]
MAVRLRLKRMGKKKQPVYKLVAADARSPRDGKFIEAIGLYNPKSDPAVVEINQDRALYWLGVGAQPTDTVRNLLSAEGVLLKHNLKSKKVSEEKFNSEVEDWQKKQEAKKLALAGKKEAKKKTAEKDLNKTNDAAEVKGTASGENE